MTNPWLELGSEPPYLLEMDSGQIRQHDSQRHASGNLGLDSIPEPFIGNTETARVVLLSLNPGYSAEGSKAHRNPDLKEAIFRNLKGQAQQYPFYPLNPAFSWSPTARWWVPRTRELRQATGLTDLVFSERLLAIEWFPYPSKSAGLPRTKLCKSQEYTFDLAKRVSTTTFVLRMRSVNHWSAVDPRFLDVPSLNNPQCSHISRRNTEGDTFDRMVEALTAN